MKQTRRSIYKGGYLQFENLTYRGENLAGYAGESVVLRFDPKDITTILVYRQTGSQEEFLARAYAQDLETEELSLDEAKAMSRRIRQAGKEISNRSILAEVQDRETFVKQKKTKKECQKEEQVKTLHDWLDGKRQSRQSGRVLGESRTGKTMGCDAYRLRHKPKQEPGKPPQVPVAYIQIPQECSAKELFTAIIEYLKYQMTKGTVAEIRDRKLRVLKGCGVEMLIIDEADRLKPKTFAEVRDIFDKLEIAVILVGTDRFFNSTLLRNVGFNHRVWGDDPKLQ
jgi:hypothetical protein